MAGANVRRWGPVSPEPRPTCEGQVSTIGCSPLEYQRAEARQDAGWGQASACRVGRMPMVR